MRKTMIKKLLRAYNTSRELKFEVLAHGEVVRVALPQLLEHQIDGVLELLVILPHLHRVEHLQQGGDVLLLLRGLGMDVPDEGRVEKRLRLDPKIVPGLALPPWCWR